MLVYGGAAPAGMLGDDLVARASAEPPVRETEGTGATMIYTSGTTGKPKGAYRKMTDQSTAVALIGSSATGQTTFTSPPGRSITAARWRS